MFSPQLTRRRFDTWAFSFFFHWQNGFPQQLISTKSLRDRPKSSTSPAKGNSLQRGAGGQEAHSYFLDRPGDVDLKNGLKWKLNGFTLFQLSVLMKIIQNELTSDHLIYNSYVSINPICELIISTNCQFPFRGGPSENYHEFPFGGDVELFGWSLMIYNQQRAVRRHTKRRIGGILANLSFILTATKI